jgi:hypothetical protein
MSCKHTRRSGALAVIGLSLSGAAAWGQTIDVCGQLTQTTPCILFQSDTGTTFVLDTANGFTSGDRVHVVGTVNVACVPICLGATSCMTVTLIGPCGTQFSACGTLVQAGMCLLFEADTSGTYLLDQTGGFVAGDRVEVSGTLNPNCINVCQPGNGCITVATVVACGASFSSCGLIVQRGSCVAFAADRGGVYALDSTGGFAVGDRVRVAGTLDLTCTRPCPTLTGCIHATTVSACGTSFSGCGTLVLGAGCVLFAADAGGTYVLSNQGNFHVGDHVRVDGALGATCANTCTAAATCITNNTIESCEAAFTGCGTLTQSTLCVLFRADSGSTYALDNLDGFVVGDRVQVTGTLDPTCIGICQASSGCIRNNTIVSGATVCGPAPVVICPTAATVLIAVSLEGLLRGRRTA